MYFPSPDELPEEKEAAVLKCPYSPKFDETLKNFRSKNTT